MRARRRPLVDVLVTDDGTAVLVDDHVLVLSPVAAMVLDRLHPVSWTDASALTEPLVTAFGEPPGDPVSAVEQTLSQMEGQGLLEVKSADASAREVDKG